MRCDECPKWRDLKNCGHGSRFCRVSFRQVYPASPTCHIRNLEVERDLYKAKIDKLQELLKGAKICKSHCPYHGLSNIPDDYEETCARCPVIYIRDTVLGS